MIAVDLNQSALDNRPPRALVAQLDRASGYEPEGRGFDSLPAHHYKSFDAPVAADQGQTQRPNKCQIGEMAEWSKALPC